MALREGLDQRQVAHRDVWARKETIRRIYRDYHSRLLKYCPQGRLLEVGSGTAHIKEIRSDVVSTDILAFPGIDVVGDAHSLPFANDCFSGVVMIDVLHHLERPIEFLREAGRVLRSGGRLAMIEPAMTMVAYPFYQYIHEEPVDLKIDPFTAVNHDPLRDPFDANQAIPTLLFATDQRRKRLEGEIEQFRVVEVDWLSLLAYPLSGGLKEWCLIPPRLLDSLLRVEAMIPKFVRRNAGFRILAVLEKV
ncbi:SAM-dependent methyltransferase [Bradyrhizobium sp. Y36]|uniref:class I SAM-dependent methyltransferase n=1 Tax=Bradyrhizobium sp. Y36 TaxID=2035447 RepID=UPI000BE97ED8|nr:class I SAM-dependent methyltransferase [Bradyrhizobium sp. Y36]PDT83347.1 SAM-dependent methyltransferase [Bradyrhizobium sp. Y36]